MAKKKVQYPKRKGQIIKGSIISLLVLIVIAAGVYGYNVWDKQSKSYIMTFDGTKISSGYFAEYLNYFTTMQGDDVDAALSDFESYLIITRTAADKGFVLTDEDKDGLSQMISFYKSFMDAGYIAPLSISDERFMEFMSIEPLYGKLYDDITKDYVADESAIKADFESKLANNEIDISRKIKYIVTNNIADAEAAKEQLSSGSTFDDMISEYSILYTEGDSIEDSNLNDFTFGLDGASVSELEALNANETSGIIDLGNGNYGIFLITQTPESVEASAKDNYIKGEKDAIFNAEYVKWAEAHNIEINQKALNAYK